MAPHSTFKSQRSGFTLIELLVTVAIIALLAALIISSLPGATERGKQTASLNNLRQIGFAFLTYASDNDQALPQRVRTGDKWPLLLHPYIENDKIFADPGDERNHLKTGANPLENIGGNYTSYLMNGYNDLGALDDETVPVRLPAITRPSQVALLGIKRYDIHDYYLDLTLKEQTFINRSTYKEGSNYLFADGSVHYIKSKDYDAQMWAVNKPETAPAP